MNQTPQDGAKKLRRTAKTEPAPKPEANGALVSTKPQAAPTTANGAKSSTAIQPVTPGTFAVVDAKSANWVVRHILEARAYASRVDEWAEAEKQRAAEAEAFFMARYGEQLETFARAAIDEQNQTFKHDPRKSIKLPSGALGFRAQPVRVRVVDEPSVLTWCKRNLPAAVRVVERVSRTAINDHYEATGQMPEGSALDAEADRFYVR